MAKLLSYFSLCPIVEPKELLGVAEGKEEGTIINTLGRNIIIIIKLNSQKQMKSWATIEKLDTRVVYDRESDRYVGGFGNNYLKCWSETTEDLKKVKKIKTAKAIQDIVSVNGTTLVVFVDGSCSALDTILSNVKNPDNYSWPGPLKKGSKILKVDVMTEEAGDPYVTLLVEHEDTERSWFYYKVQGTGGGVEEAIVAPPVGVVHLKRDNTVKLLNSCVALCNRSLCVLSIWSDKRMMRQEITEGAHKSDVGHFVEMINFVRLDQPFSICCPTKNYVAIYGGSAQQEGSSLMLYNLQYNIIEATQNFKVLFVDSRLWTLGTNIILATGQSLSVFPFYVAQEELLHLIGSLKLAAGGGEQEEASLVQMEMIDETGDLQNFIEFQQQMPPTAITVRADGDVPLTEGKFDEMVDVLLSSTAVRVFEGGESVAVVVNEDPAEDSLSLPVRTLVQALEARGFSEMEVTNEVVPHLIHHGAVGDLMAMLRLYTTLSEGVLVDCLHAGIKTENRQLLCRVLAVDFEEEYLIYNLRKRLTIEEVLYLLQFLYECLAGDCECPGVRDVDLSDVVLKWLACVVDAHYTNILMSKSKRVAKQFARWRTLIERHIEGLQQLAAFSAMVERMAHAKSSNVTASSKWYSIEVLRI